MYSLLIVEELQTLNLIYSKTGMSVGKELNGGIASVLLLLRLSYK